MSAEKKPAIILVRPQMGENIGAAARAMLNFGLTDLRLVNPRDGWPNQSAIDMASGALDTVQVTLFDDMATACADFHHVYATTARPREMVKPVQTPREAAEGAHSQSAGGQMTGFVFGCERSGLENDELSECQTIITIPTNPDFSSLNLGQSVLLLAYEWFQAAGNDLIVPPEITPAIHKDLNNFLERLIALLEEQGFFRSPDLKPTITRNIRSMLSRPGFTEQEISTLQGIVSALHGPSRQ